MRSLCISILLGSLFFLPLIATAQTTQPTTSPADEKLYNQILQTRLAQIIEGKKEITWNDIRQPDFWYENIKDLIVTVVVFIPRLIGTIAFLFVFWLVYRGVRRMVMGNMKKGDIDSSIRDLLGSMIKWTVMGFGVVIACNQLGIPIVAMLTGVSIIGLAVGFAAQETLANFIAGIVIFIDKPFKVGDWVAISDTYGRVRRVTFRSTRLLTLDGEYVIFPNTQVLSNKLTNHSTHPANRVNVAIGISYSSSIDKAREVLISLTKDDERLEKEPLPEVVVVKCNDSSVDLMLRFWIADEAIERKIVYEYTEKAKKAFDAAGIEIPFPHVQLVMDQPLQT